MYQLQPRFTWHETSWAKAMACTKPWIVGVRVEPGYSCIIERLEILRDSGVFFVKKSYFPHLEMKTMLHNRNLENKPDWALTKFFLFSMISKERCGRALGWTWSKGASRRVGQMLRGLTFRCVATSTSEPLFFPLFLLIFAVTFFPLHKVFWGKKTPWIQWFNRSFSPLGYILLVVVDGDKQSPFTMDPWPRWIVCAAALKLLPPDLLEGHLPDKP